MSSTKYVFIGPMRKTIWSTGLWLAETFTNIPLKPLNRIQRNLTRSKVSTSSTTCMFFGPIVKLRWPSWPRISWYIFDFSETAEQNSKKVDRKQHLNFHYQVSVVWADRQVKMAAAASDRLIHFRLAWNRRTEFKETWQEARSQRPLQSLCFSCRLVKQDGLPGQFVKKWDIVFRATICSPLRPLFTLSLVKFIEFYKIQSLRRVLEAVILKK